MTSKLLSIFRISSVILFFYLPLIHLYAPVQGTTGLKYVNVFWDSILHISIWPIMLLTFAVGLWIASKHQEAKNGDKKKKNSTIATNHPSIPLHTYEFLVVQAAKHRAFVCIAGRIKRGWKLPAIETTVIIIVACITIAQAIQSQLQVVQPGWLWNPFLWGTYKVYSTNAIPKALEGVCIDEADTEMNVKPLCLSKVEWEELSSGMISSRHPKDVTTVLKGINYAKHISGGLVINIMSRDTIDHILPLRQNVEGLLPFFSNLSVVVFENDSKDGSREAFVEWSKEVSERGHYDVDVMECEEAPGCKFNTSHRYESIEAGEDYFSSSAIGPMAKFRQRMVDYILKSPKYVDYSHVLVMDLDIGVSLSPLGVLHSLGLLPNKVVASASRQVWPGSFGTLIPPYDFAPFRAVETPSNQRLLSLTQTFCEFSEPGDRWRNQCESVSPLHLVLILSYDRSGTEPYQVASAFNGATLYPLALIRKTSNAKYDAGDDLQRCEHVGFNLAFKDAFYINPKWRMHLSPARPGGPDGEVAMKNIARIVGTPKISLTIFFGTLGCMVIVVYCTIALAFYSYPVFVAGLGYARPHGKDYKDN